MKKLFFTLFSISIILSCNKKKQLNGYSYDSNGFYYKLLSIGDGNNSPIKNQVVVLDAVMKTLNDSVFWDTEHDLPNGLYFNLSENKTFGICTPYFEKMTEGDSVSFMMRTSIFFKTFFNSDVPSFCKNDSLIKLNVKLQQIISLAEYAEIKENIENALVEDTELQELQEINNYLTKNNKQIKPDYNGIYVLEKQEGTGISVESGKKLKIEYQGFFLDGKPLDNTKQQLEFIYGTPDQLLNGLNIVISSLKKNETIKIILPSRLAFGEKGSSNGSVLPYTPLLYKVTIIDIQ